VLFSLQSTVTDSPFTGPSLRWYQAVLRDTRLTSALVNSLLVAVLSRCRRHLGFSPPGDRTSSCRAGYALITLPLTVSYPHHRHGLLVLFLGRRANRCLPPVSAMVINLPLCFAIIYSQMGDHQISTSAPRTWRARWKVLLLITVPVMAPAIFAAFFCR
jgi:spermidine/putrescine transport system permease protein